MSRRLEEFDDATVAVITFGDQEAVANYLLDHDFEPTILIDSDRIGYRAFGCGRGTVRRVWGWRAGLRYLEIVRRRGLRELHRPTDDTLQLGGDFVVAANGVLTFAFWAEGPDDRPTVDDLVAAVYDAAPR